MPRLKSGSSTEGEGAPPWRELCVVCNHPVYLAQRLRVQGNLYHRTCFRCARCSAQLTLVDYYETHDGKFCCETCPDEVTADKTLDPKPSEIDGEFPLEVEESHWTNRPSPTPELSPTTRQSIVAMRRMFFDTDDAKLTRCETLRTDLPPADIPIPPNDQVKPQIVHSPITDKLSDSLKQNSVELPNTGACVEYQSDSTSPRPSKRTLVDKSNHSGSILGELEIKSRLSPIDSNGGTSELNDTILAKSDKSPSPRYTDKIGVKVLPALPTKLVLGRTTDDTVDVKINNNDETKHPNHDDDDAPCIEASKNNSTSHEVNTKESPEPPKEIVESTTTKEPNKSELSEVKDHESPNVSLIGNSEVIDDHKTDFGENEGKKEEVVVEAVNPHLVPPSRPTRRQKSPKAHPRERKPKPPLGEYPEDLNPFGDEDEEETEEPSAAGTNPFGSDSEEEFDSTAMTSTPLTSPYKTPARPTPSASPGSDRRMPDLSPIRKVPSLNPFEDSDDELDEEKPAKPVPLPRKTLPSPEPPRVPFPRSALRASQRSIDSTFSTSSRKKRPAPPPPTPPSPSSTIRSTRSRKTRRAPLPPGMASSRLSLASDSISLGGFSVAESMDLPVQISAVTDRITEWVATSKLETSYDTTRSVADDSMTSRSFAENSASELQPTSPIPPVDSKSDASSNPKPCASPIPVIEIADDSVSSTNRDEVLNLKNESHEEPKTIEVTPSTSPMKIRDLSPSDEPLDNRIDPVIEIKAGKNIENIESIDKLQHDKLKSEVENMKEIKDRRKSVSDSIGSDHIEHIIKRTESGGLTLTRSPKKLQAPRPLEPKVSITNRNSATDSDVEDRLLNNKKNKDDVNMTRKISGSSTESSSGGFSLHKSAHGQWKRKKAPAPPLPLNPDQRVVKKDIPLLKIKQELNDIEIKQQGLERQGVALEARIRDKFDSDASITPYVEELVLQLFELVNEKNELFRKQAELMYLRRQQHLEEEQADLEKEIRALMGRPEANKTDTDKELEEQLIQRLVEVVERRDAIVQCLEMDRIREAEEDRSISAQLNVFTKAMAPDDKTATSPKKRKSYPEGTKKKWYTLSRSPKKTHS